MCNEERSEKAALLFEEAIEIADLKGRAAFLEAACAGDPLLLAQVEAFVCAHAAAGDFLKPDIGLSQTGQDDDSGQAVRLKPGAHLGPYHLLEIIAEGGSSTVYLAEQAKPVRRWVALKVVKPGMDTHRIISRFELERQALALMDHPGIAKIFDAGATSHGRPFFVMELVRGNQITQYCEQNRLDIPQRLELFIKLCQAVLHAHQKGIVHRDIKPDNVLVCEHDGAAFPKIIDFGIAKVLHDSVLCGTPGTGTMPFLGTPAYMSPEQAQLTMPNLDTRTDIYSLGALLYELLTGHPPFDHEALMAAGIEEMCRMIRLQDPPNPSTRLGLLSGVEGSAVARTRRTTPEALRRSLIGDLDWICMKALEKDRERRYETAAAMADDISRHSEHLPVSAAAPTLRYRFSKLVRRNRKSVLAGAAVGITLLVSTLVTGYLMVWERKSADRARTLQTAAIEAEQASQQAVVAMHITSGLSAADDGDHDRAVLWFANAAQTAEQVGPDVGANLRRALTWLDHAAVPVAAVQLSSAFSVLEFSSHSQYLLAMDRMGGWTLLHCEEHEPAAWPTHVGPITAAAWHPDGSMLALAQGRVLQIRNASDGKLLHRISTAEDLTAVGFTPDGARLLFGGRAVHALDLRTGSLLGSAWDQPEPITGFAFAPQSNLGAIVSPDASARIFLSGNRELEEFEVRKIPHRGCIRTDACSSKTRYRDDYLEAPTLSLPAFSQGNALLTRTGPYEISAWDLGTAKVIRSFDGMCCSCRFVMSPDGAFMACGLQESKIGIWEIATGRQSALLNSHGSCILDVAFGPSGETLLAAEAGGRARVWSTRESAAIFSSMHHTAEVDKVAFAPNGQVIATAQVDGLVRLWVLPKVNPSGKTFALDYGPWIVRADSHGDHFVTTKEPASEAEIRTVRVYSAATGKPFGQNLKLPGSLEDAALSPDCKRLVLALSGIGDQTPGIVQFVEVATGRVLEQFALPSAPAALGWHKDARRVAVICRGGELMVVGCGDKEPTVWAEQALTAPARIVPFVSFTPDGDSLVSLAPSGRVQVRDSSTGDLRFPPLCSGTNGFWSIAISDDSSRMATTTTQGEVRVWDLMSGVQLGSILQHADRVYRSRFSPDGTRLLTVSHDAKCRIWDLGSGELSGPPLEHPNEVYDGAFWLDGSSVLTACRDGYVRLWELRTGLPLAPPFKAGAQAFNLEVTTDGRSAVIGSLGTTIQILSLPSLDKEIPWSPRDLCLLAEVVSGSAIAQGVIRDLTTTEWQQRFNELRRTKIDLFHAAWASRSVVSLQEEIVTPTVNPIAADSVQGTLCPNWSTCGVEDCPGSKSQ